MTVNLSALHADLWQALRDQKALAHNLRQGLDRPLIYLLCALISVGLVFEASASIAVAQGEYGDGLYYFKRHLIHLMLGLTLGALVFFVPVRFWMRIDPALLFFSILLLCLVLIPGIGHKVNGSRRWLDFGLMSFQVSEFAKLAMLLYLSGYIVRRQEEIRSHWLGFHKPLIVLALILGLMVIEPDLGSSAVLACTVLATLFLAGIPMMRFIITLIAALFVAYCLVVFKGYDYHLERIEAFLDPWAHRLESGYQLTQSLVAFGRGEWFGVGLGNSVQKLFYLPEAHTDFVFAVIAEETGLVGGLALIGLIWVLSFRVFKIGRRAIELSNLHSDQIGYRYEYQGYFCLGVSLLFIIQSATNLGVACGLLPTKGLTLPFVSYGGSSMLIWCLMMAMVLRVASDINGAAQMPSPVSKRSNKAGKARAKKNKQPLSAQMNPTVTL